MKLLLPHRFKKFGATMVPVGILLFASVHLQIVRAICLAINQDMDFQNLENANVTVGITGFYLFLAGMCFLSFSKEKIEDEMVKVVRVSCFQQAALLQLVLNLAGFGYVALQEQHSKELLLTIFVVSFILFWIVYVIRFNYLIHLNYKN